MPIKYTAHNEGQLFHAIVSGTVTDKELLDYEKFFVTDDRISPGADVVFEIKPDSISKITKNGVLKAIEQRVGLPIKARLSHCAIVTQHKNRHIWKTAQLYKKENEKKFPGVVIVIFCDLNVAKKWLNIKIELMNNQTKGLLA